MMRRISRSRKSKAQAMAEFALIFPILILTIFAIIDFGWMVFNFSQLYNSLREGTRYGSVKGYTTPAQFVDCDGIRQRIVSLAGFSGIKNDTSNIKIWYDDGRALAADYDALPTRPAQEVGYCDSAYAANGAYVPNGGSATSREPGNGDRIVIDVDVNVPFLTPFFKAFVPSGIRMHFRSARSIFPTGLAS